MKYFLSMLLLFLIFIGRVYSQRREFVRDYTYIAGDSDSKNSSRIYAIEQLKRVLLEEVGVFIQSKMLTIKNEKNGDYTDLTQYQIESITAGIIETKIIEDKWTGDKYYIKVSMSIDPQEVAENIQTIARDKRRLRDIEDLNRRADNAFAEITILRAELAEAKTEYEKLQKRKLYDAVTTRLNETNLIIESNQKNLHADADNSIHVFDIASLFTVSDQEKEYLNGWYGGIGYSRTNFPDLSAYGLKEHYGEGYAILLGYIDTPFLYRCNVFIESVHSSDNRLYNDYEYLNQGLAPSISYSPISSLKYFSPYGGIGYQIEIKAGEYSPNVASSAPFWCIGLQFNFRKYYSPQVGLGIAAIIEYNQSIQNIERRRNGLIIGLGIRIHPR